jgi:glycosyltransferase involved in cell wall biosynthesis
MRITIATETFAPQVNGVSRTLVQLVRALERAGDAVQVVYPNYGGLSRPNRVRVRSFRPPFYRELYLPLPPFRRVRRAIDAFRPDVVHVATEATLGLAVLRHALRRGVPVVSSFHTNFDQYAGHYGLGWAQALVWRYLRWFHNRTRETYVPSRATIAALEARGFERLVLWSRGVDSRVFRPDRPGREAVRAALGFGPDDVVVGHVSRIAAEKNVEYLGEVLARVVERRPDVRLLIVGDGPARPELEARLGPGARFVGYKWGDELADHYAAADVFAFASRTETFGNVVLEAMASGLPVVALRAGGPGEFVRDDETGFLIDPDAPPPVFAEAIIRLADAPGPRRRMAAAARAYALTRSWDAIMRNLRGRYEAVIAASSGRSLAGTSPGG